MRYSLHHLWTNKSESHISARGAFEGEGDIISNSDELRNTAELNSSKKVLCRLSFGWP